MCQDCVGPRDEDGEDVEDHGVYSEDIFTSGLKPTYHRNEQPRQIGSIRTVTYNDGEVDYIEEDDDPRGEWCD